MMRAFGLIVLIVIVIAPACQRPAEWQASSSEQKVAAPTPTPTARPDGNAKCAGGDYNDRTEADARADCAARGLNFKFVRAEIPAGTDGTVACECQVEDASHCFSYKGNAIPKSVIDACNKADKTTWHRPSCACLGDGWSSFSVSLCFGIELSNNAALIEALGELETNIKKLETIYWDDEWEALQYSLTAGYPDATTWGNVLKKIRCWWGGATAYLNDPAVKTFNRLVNAISLEIDGVPNPSFGYDSCPINALTIEWQCPS